MKNSRCREMLENQRVLPKLKGKILRPVGLKHRSKQQAGLTPASIAGIPP